MHAELAKLNVDEDDATHALEHAQRGLALDYTADAVSVARFGRYPLDRILAPLKTVLTNKMNIYEDPER